MWKLKSVGDVREFLSSEGRSVWLVGLMLLGAVLLIIGSNSSPGEVSVKDEEARAAEMCAMMEGVGECRVMMTYRPDSEEVYAVLVLCEGAESVAVRERVTSLFTSLYGIGANRVEVEILNKTK